jgi:hypothetical protein
VKSPIRQIVQNSGEEGAIIMGKIRENDNQSSYPAAIRLPSGCHPAAIRLPRLQALSGAHRKAFREDGVGNRSPPAWREMCQFGIHHVYEFICHYQACIYFNRNRHERLPLFVPGRAGVAVEVAHISDQPHVYRNICLE